MGRFLVPALGIAVLYYVWRHPKGWAGLGELLRPLVLVALALLYLRSPIDLIPDVSPVGFLDDLAIMLAALYFGSQQRGGTDSGSERRSRPAREPERDASDPFEVLGVPRGASSEEITRAFRSKMKQYHPDRVADLGEELRDVAHEKSVEIQQAYEALKKR